jgi:CHRD domain
MGSINRVRRLGALALIVIASGVAAQSGSRATEFTARITRVPISPAERNTITGSGSATAELAGRTLHVAGSFTGLQGPATVATLREGPVMGVRGPSIATLDVTAAQDGRINGNVELTADQVDALREGRIYIQLDSAPAPDGNLWGWLLAPERRR